MKKILVILIIASVAFIGCSTDKKENTAQDTTVVTKTTDTVEIQDTTTTTTTTTKKTDLGKEYTSHYICPMHCKGSGSDKPGTCPVCGMEYIENPDYKAQ